MVVRTVGGLKKILKEYPDEMPLFLVANCYTGERTFASVRPDENRLWQERDLRDGGVERIFLVPAIEAFAETHEKRATKKGKSRWKYMSGDYLRIGNANPEDMRLVED